MDRRYQEWKRAQAQKRVMRVKEIRFDEETANSALCPEGQRPCPVCGRMMLPKKLDGEVVDVCTAHGQWFDEGELPRLVVAEEKRQSVRYMRQAEREVDKEIAPTRLTAAFIDPYRAVIDALAEKRTSPSEISRLMGAASDATEPIDPHPNARIVAEGRRPCPICKKSMQSRSFQSDMIDHCPDHGFWFDDGELRRFLNVSATKGAKQRAFKNRYAATMRARIRNISHHHRYYHDHHGGWSILDLI